MLPRRAEVELLGQSDDAQLAYICAQKRVMVTHDADFLRFASQTSGDCFLPERNAFERRNVSGADFVA